MIAFAGIPNSHRATPVDITFARARRSRPNNTGPFRTSLFRLRLSCANLLVLAQFFLLIKGLAATIAFRLFLFCHDDHLLSASILQFNEAFYRLAWRSWCALRALFVASAFHPLYVTLNLLALWLFLSKSSCTS